MTIDDKWMELLSDEARADVMKTLVAETETTKRKIIEETQATQRHPNTSDNRMFTRIWMCIVIALTVAFCVGVHECSAPTHHQPVAPGSVG